MTMNWFFKLKTGGMIWGWWWRLRRHHHPQIIPHRTACHFERSEKSLLKKIVKELLPDNND
jgi:hypothetical protein